MKRIFLFVFFAVATRLSAAAQTKAKPFLSSLPLNKGLVVFCDFDEGKGALLTDYSGNNRHGRIAGLPQSGWVLGNGRADKKNPDRAVDLSYANRSVTFSNLNATSNGLTVSLWLQPAVLTQSSGEQILFTTGGAPGFGLKMLDDGTLVFSANEGQKAVLLSTQKLKPYQWHQVAVTVDNPAKEAMLYINGQPAGRKKAAGFGANLKGTFTVGKTESEAAPGFDGNVDDLLLYDRKLSAQEVALLAEGVLPQKATATFSGEEEKLKTASPPKTTRSPLRQLSGLDAGDFPANPLQKAGYVLTANDEFNGPKLNEDLWIPYYIRQRVSDEAGLAEYEFRDGSILLKITKDKANYNDKGMRVSSLQTLENSDLHKPGKRTDVPMQKKFLQQYGYFEIRAKTQLGPGHCSSFWLLGEGGMRVNRHLTGEIDVIEQPGNLGPNSVAFNLYDWSDSTIGTRITNMGWQNRLRLNKDLTKTFNIYGCEWTPTEIKFYFNNRLINIIPNSIHYPMGVFLSLYEGNDWFGTLDGSQAHPKEFVIDYFRAYAKKQN